ncbi:macro domain-containing protein, partial [Candidatus Poribacteria bacterium]|nr:macro domain-containing protein [Candidatus Poribacteria bacterium]
MEKVFGRIVVRTGDLTAEDTDAIVNAANSSLMGGGGVDGAIHRAGGPQILEECRRIRATTHPDGLPVGEAVSTSGGRLKARYVIHTVGPVWHGGNQGEPELLASCYRNALVEGERLGVQSVAFP